MGYTRLQCDRVSLRVYRQFSVNQESAANTAKQQVLARTRSLLKDEYGDQ